MLFNIFTRLSARVLLLVLISFCLVGALKNYQAYHASKEHISSAQESHIAQELFHQSNAIRQHLILLIMFLLILLACITLLYVSYKPFDHRYIWHASLLMTIGLIIAMVIIWYITSKYPSYEEQTIHLANDHDIAVMLEKNGHTVLPESPSTSPFKQFIAPKAISTGIFLQNADLISEQKIQINGYIWQHYYDHIHDGITRGFLLPHATRSAIKKIKTTHTGNRTTILWEVKAILYQNFSYERYPFDTKEVEIALWHPDFAQNVILIPDLNAYETINPLKLPGLSSRASSHGWHILQSHFGYKTHAHNVDFGMHTPHRDQKFETELFFELLIKRNLLPIFIMNLIPLLVILLLLFIIFLSDYLFLEHIFWQISGIFFSAAVVQSQLITKIPSSNPIYFESFYLLIYGIIITFIALMTLNLMKFNIPFLKDNNKIVSQLLYWPIVLSGFYAITVYYLY